MENAASARKLLTVQMFWHGTPLSRIERLCVASFVAHGHPLHLYVYDTPAEVLPGVRLMQAEEILPRSLLFRHPRTASLGPFSDWFRYRLLEQRGGIWADADVVCLAPLVYPQAEIFGWQDASSINNAVLGLPAGHELAAWMAAACADPNQIRPYDSVGMRLRKWRRRYLGGNRRERIRWGEYGPKGLTRAARHLGYLDRAQPAAHFYPVPCQNWRSLFESRGDRGLPWLPESRAIHLWQEMMQREAGFDKGGQFPSDSPFEALCRRYGLEARSDD